MVYFASARHEDMSPSIDVWEAIGRLPEANRFTGPERYMFIAELMGKMSGEIAYVESYIKNLVETRKNYQISDGFGDNSFQLGCTDQYRLRLVRWTPKSMITLPDINNVGLSYDYPHNHDFHLLTKGIFGDGYSTDVYQCDAKKIVGTIGEEVPLAYQGRFKLSPGAVMWYDRYVDVHEQYPPETFSMSLNIIPVDRDITIAQYAFDTTNEKIIEFTRNRHSQIMMMLTLLCDFSCDDETRNILIETAESVNNTWFKRAVAALMAERWHTDIEESMELLKVHLDSATMAKLTPDSFSVRHVQ